MIFKEFSNNNQFIWILNAKDMAKTILLSLENAGKIQIGYCSSELTSQAQFSKEVLHLGFLW